MRLLIIMLSTLAIQGSAFAASSTLTIKNNFLEAAFDPSANTLSIRSLTEKTAFIPAGKLVNGGNVAKLVKVSHPIFGRGQGIEVVSTDGKKDEIMLYPKLPFVLIRRTITNSGTEPMVINREQVFSANLDLGKPVSNLSVLGTNGFNKANTGVGSYAWIAVAHPVTRTGIVAGWITNDIASGVLFTKVKGGEVNLTARSDFGTLRIKPGAAKLLETLAIGYFNDARLGLEAWADAVAKVYKIKLPPIPTGYCTWYHAGASDEKTFVRDTNIAAKKLKPFGFDFMQIDDGWQDGQSKNGPRKNFTQVRPGGPYAGGMKPVAEAVKAKGLTAGIWFMPFSGNWDDPWFADKQDWFFKTKDGKPYEANWSGTLLDMTNPKSQAYLRDEVKRISDWGYCYFKMDGLHSGLGCIQTYANMGYKEDNFGDSILYNPDKTNIEAFRDGLKIVREVAAKDTFILGCAAPQNMRSYGSSFGLVDAMRIGPDNGGDWGGWLTSPRASTAHYFLNGRIWYNDPDPVYLRDSISTDQTRAMCSWQAITGSLTVFSDSIGNLTDERIDIIRRMIPTHTATARPVDVFENDQRRTWLVTDAKTNQRRDIIGIFNWTNDPIKCDYDMSYIGLDPVVTYAAYDFWSGDLTTIKGNIAATLAPTSCQVLAVRPLLDRPFLLSTNRHVTQGIVDVIEEKWDAKTNTLSGRSRIVGGDPYELRIAAVSPKADWAAISATVSASGVKIEFGKKEKGMVKATITAPTNCEVSWSVKFNSNKTGKPVVFGQE